MPLRSLAALVLAGAQLHLATEPVEVIVNRVGPARGMVVGVICSKDEFRSFECRQTAVSGVPVNGRATLHFEVPAGIYAVSIFHDLNGNRRLRRSFIGLPLEGVGFSRNPHLFGRPKFEDAAIVVPHGGLSLAINLQFEPRG